MVMCLTNATMMELELQPSAPKCLARDLAGQQAQPDSLWNLKGEPRSRLESNLLPSVSVPV